MILVTYKSYAESEFKHGYGKYEIYRLINTLYSEINGYMAICERLYDEKPTYVNDQVEKKKGDLFAVEIKYLRVISNSSEEEVDRENYLKELHILIHGKNAKNI